MLTYFNSPVFHLVHVLFFSSVLNLRYCLQRVCFLALSSSLLTFASSDTALVLLWSLGVIFSLSGVFLLICWQDAAFILDFIRSPRSSYICHSQVSHCSVKAACLLQRIILHINHVCMPAYLSKLLLTLKVLSFCLVFL